MYALVLLWCVRQMRMVQSGIMIAVIGALILLWCVRQMRMVQNEVMSNSGHSCMHLYYCGVYVKCVWFKVE